MRRVRNERAPCRRAACDAKCPVRHSSISGGWSSDDRLRIIPRFNHNAAIGDNSGRLSGGFPEFQPPRLLVLGAIAATPAMRNCVGELDSRHNGLLVARCAGMRHPACPTPSHRPLITAHWVDVAQHYDARLAGLAPSAAYARNRAIVGCEITTTGKPAAKAQLRRCWSTVPAAPLATFAAVDLTTLNVMS